MSDSKKSVHSEENMSSCQTFTKDFRDENNRQGQIHTGYGI